MAKKKETITWDVPLEEEIKYFDPTRSYELTGYRPINDTKGLDFDPEWFITSRLAYERTGHYTTYRFGTKAYNDFWKAEYTKCRDGCTEHGYTITGDHYFFLNYYILENVTKTEKAATGRLMDFPNFSVAQYEYLHYVELAKRLRKNICLMKARGLGFSQMNAAIVANMYSTRLNSKCMITANLANYTKDTLDKIWKELAFLNDHTDGGFFKLTQVIDRDDRKRASAKKKVNGLEIEVGWMSEVIGKTADTPNKIRGDRVDLLVFEEAGSWPGLQKAVVQGNALILNLGHKFGIEIIGGTGGDSGPALEGLRTIYYDPYNFDVLPFKHNFTDTGEYVQTGYFLPATSLVLEEGFMDHRGWCDPKKCREFHLRERDRFKNNPRGYLDYIAEYCFTAEEAFAKEGLNNFNREIIAEQLSQIRLLKKAPTILTGNISYLYKNNKHELENICGYRWDLNSSGKIHILEHPIWSEEYKKQQQTILDLYANINEQYDILSYSEMANLYVAGIDSIDISLELTSENTDNPSKFCIIIYKRTFGGLNPKIVAYYMERPEHDIRDAYKTAMCLVKYYLAIINIEATRMNMYSWAREHGMWQHFMMRPRATYPDPTKVGKRTPGTPATPKIIDHLLRLIESFINDYGHEIWFESMLLELQTYSYESKTHFDMVAALGMALLADEELGDVNVMKLQREEDTQISLLGYYKDKYGHKRYGIIPNQQPNIKVSWEFGDGSLDSSRGRNNY